MTTADPAIASDTQPEGLLTRIASANGRYALLGLLLVAALAGVIAQFFAIGGYWTDDAFISFRYAANLADGHGPVWNPGERVEGYTNFGWVLLLALAIKGGVDPVDASRGFGLLAAAGTLALVPVLAAQLRPAWSTRWWVVAGGTVLALAFNTAFSVWTFAGLETPASMFFLTAGITLHLWEERTGRTPLWSAPAFLAAALVRPDAVVVWAVTALFKCAGLLRGVDRRSVSALALWAAAFLVPFGIYWLWRWGYYGDFFPNTYYLKTGRNSDLLQRGVEYTTDFVAMYSMWLALAALFSAWRERASAYRPALYLLAICAAWTLYVVDAGGDWMPFFRFFVPLLPMIYILIAHSLVDVTDAVAGRTKRASWALPAATVVVGAVALSAIAPYDAAAARNPQGLGVNSRGMPGAVDVRIGEDIGEWMAREVPKDATVAVIASGMVPYYSGARSIDMLGVNDQHIARLDVPLGRGPAGHEKHDGGYVISRKPEIIWLGLAEEDWPRERIEQYYPPYTIEYPVVTDITHNPYVWFMYHPVALRLRYGWLSLLVRNDAELPFAEPNPPPLP